MVPRMDHVSFYCFPLSVDTIFFAKRSTLKHTLKLVVHEMFLLFMAGLSIGDSLRSPFESYYEPALVNMWHSIEGRPIRADTEGGR